ncbi:MAG TPA: calcium-translocating P-type ATPase, PMCA-type [Clostridiales bacterium]|nr:MAG: calcium-translocating P-type ATPase, PMCA-type [Clostridiales bacterium GWD2_32_59]HAN09453.1 calcium-translocating P-type ATPase, PMCA-type [Clostridiales bacterium]
MIKKIGLNDEQVIESRDKYGDNSLSKVETESFWDKLMGNFGDPMIKILCIALAINVIFVFLGQAEWYESVGIALAVILATLVSTFSEYRNENAFQKLQEEASKIKCKVYRNGDIIEISIDDIVVGDSIMIQSGDKIPADGILIDGNIKVDQSVLNGESKEATKKAMPEDYVEEGTGVDFLNEYKVFRGTVARYGNAIMSVTIVGDKSIYGQIANELQLEEDRESPLKVKLSKLANDISKFGYIGGIAIAIAYLFQRIVMNNGLDVARIMEYSSNWMTIVNDIVGAVILAVIIIVMAVPEGLPLMIAIVSALNMGKMLKDNVLVRKIAGIETAGSLNILFSDKTGTITKGQLEAVVFVDGAGKEYNNHSQITGELGKLLSLSIQYNTNAIVTGDYPNIKVIGGNATERAIIGFIAGKGDLVSASIINAIPFNSENKYSAAQVHGDYDCTLIKGAPERIISKCGHYFDANGEKQSLTNVRVLEEQIDKLANRAIRVLALAIADCELGEDELPEGDWTLLGVIGIRDEIRPESISAIVEVQNAGIQVVMITGDRKDTAVAIAKEAGLLKNSTDLVYTSDELQEMSDDELKKKLPDIRVVARALPSDKSRFVKIAQELNLVVGMTGDGVNDSPALKKADVGFAMGGGTEVAKEASDIVIMDDNFSSIENAILYGRTIFNSIRKFIIFQLTINVAAVLISFIAPLLGLGYHPLSITQILWINLVMDTLAALAFGAEPALKRFMNEKPKRRDENIVSNNMWSSIFTGSLWVFVISIIMLFTPIGATLFRESDTNAYLLTGYFTFFVFAAVFNAFNARTDKMNLFDNIGQNKGFLKVILLISVVQLIMTYFGGVILRCAGLTINELIIVILLAMTIIPIDLIRKLVIKTKN